MDSLKKKKIDAEGAQQITRILTSNNLDGAEATNALFPLVYDELLRIAAYRLSLERPGLMLDATALVDEAYLRLIKDPKAHWENKRHFFVAVAEAMRRILIEDARRRNCKKRGGEWQRSDIAVGDIPCDYHKDEIQQVHEVLDQFEEVDPEGAELVKLRFFVGLTLQQCAEILGISKRTADNRWAFARAWLYRALHEV